MDIDKITFETNRLLGVTESFEDLDVDGDGVINKEDAAQTDNTEIKSVISDLLNSVDDDIEMELKYDDALFSKAGATSNEDSNIPTVGKDNYDDILNSKGTVYVSIGSQTGCYYCKEWEKAVSQNIDEISKYAQVYTMSYGQNKDLLKDIKNQLGIKYSVNFPFVVKFVDGKPVEALSGMRESAEVITNKLISKAENGSKTQTATDSTAENTSDAQASANTESKTVADSTTSKSKYEYLYDIQSSYLSDLQSKAESLSEEIDELEEKNEKIQKEIEEKQEQYNELVSKINNAAEGTDIVSLQDEADSLKSKISGLMSEFDSNRNSISDLQTNLSANSIAMEALKRSMENTEKQISSDKNVSQTTSVSDADDCPDCVECSESADIDWNALSVDGKGVNIYNFANLLDGDSSRDVTKVEIQQAYDNANDEQKSVLKKFFDFDENGKLTSSKEYITGFTHMISTSNGKSRPMFESLAFMDNDGDGFLSDDEICELKTKITDHIEENHNKVTRLRNAGVKGPINTSVGLNIGTHNMGIKVGMGDAACAFTQTTVNGKKVYIGYTPKRGQILTVTEDEMKVISSFLTGEDAAKYRSSNPKVLQPIWDALGAVKTQNGKTYTLDDNKTLTNADYANVFVNSAGVICSYKEYDQCAQCTNSFQMLYLGIRDMIEGKEIKYDRQDDYEKVNGKYVLKSDSL